MLRFSNLTENQPQFHATNEHAYLHFVDDALKFIPHLREDDEDGVERKREEAKEPQEEYTPEVQTYVLWDE